MAFKGRRHPLYDLKENENTGVPLRSSVPQVWNTMHFLSLPEDIKMQVYDLAGSDFHSRAEFWPASCWTFAFYSHRDPEHFAHVPLLSVCKETRREISVILAKSSPLQIIGHNRLKDAWKQPLPSLSEALPIPLNYAIHVKYIEIWEEYVDVSAIDTLPELFPQLHDVRHHRKMEEEDHEELRKLMPDWYLNPHSRKLSVCHLRCNKLYSLLIVGGKLSNAQLEESKLGGVLKEYALSSFISLDRRRSFLGDPSTRTFDLDVIYDFEFKLRRYVQILVRHSRIVDIGQLLTRHCMSTSQRKPPRWEYMRRTLG